MVCWTRILLGPIKMKGNGGTLYHDYVKIYVRGGKGGRGDVLYGGVGGDGGDVYLKAVPKMTLTKFIQKHEQKRFLGGAGRNSSRLLVAGAKGEDLYVEVPMGITVETWEGKILAELVRKDETLLAAKGGEGGSVKNAFAGQLATPHQLHLHLKLIADIGFVGFPNAGKSTLLKALSRTDPQISALPFTTIRPQIGTMVYEDYRRISLADLPGLIEGAHLNAGMGHRFLKHVERTMLLMFVVDLNGFQLSLDDEFRNAYETIMLLNKELELYDPRLLDKPALLCVNKCDTDVNNYKFTKLLDKLNRRHSDLAQLPDMMRPSKIIDFMDILPTSAKNKESAQILKSKLREYLDLIDRMRRTHTNVERTEYKAANCILV